MCKMEKEVREMHEGGRWEQCQNSVLETGECLVFSTFVAYAFFGHLVSENKCGY